MRSKKAAKKVGEAVDVLLAVYIFVHVPLRAALGSKKPHAEFAIDAWFLLRADHMLTMVGALPIELALGPAAELNRLLIPLLMWKKTKYMKQWRAGRWRAFSCVLQLMVLCHAAACSFLALKNENENENDNYTKAMYWSVSTLTTVGYGDIVPDTLSETALTAMVQMLGLLTCTSMIGSFSAVVQHGSRLRRRFDQSSAAALKALRAKGAPPSLQARAKGYFRFMWKTAKGTDADVHGILAALPSHLRIDMLAEMQGAAAQKVFARLFADAPPSLSRSLQDIIRQRAFAPGEFIARKGAQSTNIFVICRGIAVKVSAPPEWNVVSKVLREGAMVGFSRGFATACEDATVRAHSFANALAINIAELRAALTNVDLSLEAKVDQRVMERAKRQAKMEKMMGIRDVTLTEPGYFTVQRENGLRKTRAWQLVQLCAIVLTAAHLPLALTSSVSDRFKFALLPVVDDDSVKWGLWNMAAMIALDTAILADTVAYCTCVHVMTVKSSVVISRPRQIVAFHARRAHSWTLMLSALPIDYGWRWYRILRLVHLIRVRALLPQGDAGNLAWLAIRMSLTIHFVASAWSHIAGEAEYIRAFYWSLVTVSTVGYGDIVPGTTVQMAFASAACFVGCLAYCHTVGLISSTCRREVSHAVPLKRVDRFIAARRGKAPSKLRRRVKTYAIECNDAAGNNDLAVLPHILRGKPEAPNDIKAIPRRQSQRRKVCCGGRKTKQTLFLFTLTAASGLTFHALTRLAWANSIYFAISTMTAVTFGDVVPLTAGQMAFACFVIVIGQGYVANAIGSIASSITHHDPARAEWQRRVRDFGKFARARQLPRWIRQRAQQYFDFELQWGGGATPEFFQKLPRALKIDLALDSSCKLTGLLPFNIEIERLLEHMHPLLYLPGDCILQCRTHATRLVLLQEGHAEVVSSTATNVATMGPGAVCGASAFFRDSDNVLYCQSVLALTRVVAMALSKEAWHKIASSTERAAASDHAEMLMKGGKKRAKAIATNLRRPKLAGLNTVSKAKKAHHGKHLRRAFDGLIVLMMIIDAMRTLHELTFGWAGCHATPWATVIGALVRCAYLSESILHAFVFPVVDEDGDLITDASILAWRYLQHYRAWFDFVTVVMPRCTLLRLVYLPSLWRRLEISPIASVYAALGGLVYATACAWFLAGHLSKGWVLHDEIIEIHDNYCAAALLRSLYFSVTAMSTVCYGDIHATNTIETWLCVVISLASAAAFGGLAAAKEARFMHLDEGHAATDAAADQLSHILADRRTCPATTARIMRYFSLVLRNQDHVIFQDISEALRADIATYVHEDIARVPLFHQRGPKFIRMICAALRQEFFACGELIIRQDDIGNEMFLVADGTLRVFPNDGSFEVFKHSGDIFGEIALLREIPRTANVISISECVLFTLRRQDYERASFCCTLDEA